MVNDKLPCPTCEGTGYLESWVDADETERYECRDCEGTGEVPDEASEEEEDAP